MNGSTEIVASVYDVPDDGLTDAFVKDCVRQFHAEHGETAEPSVTVTSGFLDDSQVLRIEAPRPVSS